MMIPTITTGAASEEIAQQTEEFLAKGGRIEYRKYLESGSDLQGKSDYKFTISSECKNRKC